jgi:hypothetical protein
VAVVEILELIVTQVLLVALECSVELVAVVLVAHRDLQVMVAVAVAQTQVVVLADTKELLESGSLNNVYCIRKHIHNWISSWRITSWNN